MKIDLTKHQIELLNFAFAKALNALHTDVSNFTPVTEISDELRHNLVHMINDLIELRAKIAGSL